MPSLSGVTKKPTYGEAEISLFSINNLNSQSGGNLSGSSQTIIAWSLNWTSNGFIDQGWETYDSLTNTISTITEAMLLSMPEPAQMTVAYYRVKRFGDPSTLNNK